MDVLQGFCSFRGLSSASTYIQNEYIHLDIKELDNIQQALVNAKW